MRVTLLDGPLGTELAGRGVSVKGRSWSASAIEGAPHVVAAIHRDYAAAGARVHTANTFRTRARDAGARWAQLARRAVDLARTSVPCDHLVAGSMGPVEDCYRPDRSPGAAARPQHRELAAVLAAAGVDRILCETFAASDEAIVAVEEAARTGVETWVAFTAGPDASLMTPAAMGVASRACVSAGARAVFVNCTAASRTRAYVNALAGAGAPFGAYANAGGREERLGWSADPVRAADEYARLACTWVADGATAIGGCCGTGPLHTEYLARALGALNVLA